MKLEQIDTSTTEGKIKVMQLAAEGRKVMTCARGSLQCQWRETTNPVWSWNEDDYAIVITPVGPEEVWFVMLKGVMYFMENGESDATEWKNLNAPNDGRIVSYVRSDLATGE